jgi:hypothetical protein
VATAGASLPRPDWSVFGYPGVASDLKRVWPITGRTMEAIHVADQTTLAPLIRAGGVANSDFYPTLDLNAEETRFMKSEARGFASLPMARMNFAAMMDGRPFGIGDSYAVIDGIPRLTAATVAAGLHTGDPRAGKLVEVSRANRHLFEAAMASGQPPLDWHGWIAGATSIEREVHGGMAGVADTAFYAELRAYLDRMKAPEPARAVVDFMHGTAVWDFDEMARASDVLIPLAANGDRWVDPDELREGAVMAKLALGDRAGAREAFFALLRVSERPATDLRTRLIYSYIADSTVWVAPTQ